MANESNRAGAGPETPVVPEAILRSGLSRRAMLKAVGLLGGAAVVAGSGGTAWVGEPAAAGQVLPQGFTGTMADLRHVVILIQENRSFDHYYGALPGVRGLGDKQEVHYQDGTSVFEQPAGDDVPGDTITPTRVNTVAGMATELDHTFVGGTTAWNGGLYNGWVRAKGVRTMNYLTGEELPYQYALASAYTICDNHHCSIPGPTTPNRLFHWTGTSHGVVHRGSESSGDRAWETYPEVLQRAGVSWRNYVDNTASGKWWYGDFSDNPIRGFATFSPTGANLTDIVKNAAGTGLMWRAGAAPYQDHGLPDDDSDTNLDGVLADFIAACRPGARHPLPEVSWIVAPYQWSEHPAANPEHGARFTDRVIRALQANQEIWEHTLLILTFDENDGYFDHVLPPRPEPGTPGEFLGGQPLGYGARVPMILVSPWTRGGWVFSETTDHTSIIRFLEEWTAFKGKPARCRMISHWRRTISGDLTGALDFSHPVIDKPALPDTAALVFIAKYAPAIDFDSGVPVEDKWVPQARLRHRPASYHPDASFSEDRATGMVTATMTVVGAGPGRGVSLQVMPDRYELASNTPFTVVTGTPRRYRWDTTAHQRNYAFSIYGPDGFVRSHAGLVVGQNQEASAIPRAEVELVAGRRPEVRIRLFNDGTGRARFTLTAHDHAGGTRRLTVGPGRHASIAWPTREGYYDVVMAVEGTSWRHRYAGRVAQVART